MDPEAQDLGMIDLRFHLQGDFLPADHGYHLFSAISHVIPELHGDPTVGIFPIYGRLSGDRRVALTRGSRLALRIPTLRIKDFLVLAGKKLDIQGHSVRVGIPEVHNLLPASRLSCRLAVIKGLMEPDSFLEGVTRQLADREIEGEAHLLEQPWVIEANQGRKGGTRSPYVRRTIRIHGREIVGFALLVDGLNDADSIALQQSGIGGRRRFGCGMFTPARGEST